MIETIQNFLNGPITNQSIVIIIICTASCLLFYSIIKKLFKLAFFLTFICILYLAFLIVTEQELPKNKEQIKQTLENQIEKLENAIDNQKDDIINISKEIL